MNHHLQREWDELDSHGHQGGYVNPHINRHVNPHVTYGYRAPATPSVRFNKSLNPDTPKITAMRPNASKVRIRVSKTALDKMFLFVKIAAKEVGWMGSLIDQRGSNNEFYLKDVWLAKQEVSSVTTNLTQEGLGDLVSELIMRDDGMEVCNNLKFWGHSHVEMGVSPSAQDESTVRDLHSEKSTYFLRGIFNKRGKIKFTLFLYDDGLIIDDADWFEEEAAIETGLMESIQAEFNEKVTDEPVQTYYYQGGVHHSHRGFQTAQTVHRPATSVTKKNGEIKGNDTDEIVDSEMKRQLIELLLDGQTNIKHYDKLLVLIPNANSITDKDQVYDRCKDETTKALAEYLETVKVGYEELSIFAQMGFDTSDNPMPDVLYEFVILTIEMWHFFDVSDYLYFTDFELGKVFDNYITFVKEVVANELWTWDQSLDYDATIIPDEMIRVFRSDADALAVTFADEVIEMELDAEIDANLTNTFDNVEDTAVDSPTPTNDVEEGKEITLRYMMPLSGRPNSYIQQTMRPKDLTEQAIWDILENDQLFVDAMVIKYGDDWPAKYKQPTKKP